MQVLGAVLPDDPRVRDLRVTPHSLARYDELYRRREPGLTSRHAARSPRPNRRRQRPRYRAVAAISSASTFPVTPDLRGPDDLIGLAAVT